MKIECILLSNKNYELAYRLRENLKTKNIELKLATNIMQMFEFVNQNTKAIVIEDVKENIGQYSKLFSNHIQYAIVFIEKEKIYDINAKLIFEEMENFISSSIFLGEPKGYSLTQIKPAVEEVFKELDMIVVNCYGQFVKEILYFMLQNGNEKITKQHILLIGAKLGIKQYHIYEKLALFLKPKYQKINKYCDNCLTKYDCKKVLLCLYKLIENKILFQKK